MNINRTQPSKCPNCDYILDCTSEIGKEDNKPKPDDLSICMKCGQINKFDENLQIVKPTNEFMMIVANDAPEFYLDLLQLQQNIKAADVLNYYKTKSKTRQK